MCIELGFFFQAEDGIRDRVRSRGLGDVYKRQALVVPATAALAKPGRRPDRRGPRRLAARAHGGGAVSYTHQTLPNSDLV